MRSRPVSGVLKRLSRNDSRTVNAIVLSFSSEPVSALLRVSVQRAADVTMLPVATKQPGLVGGATRIRPMEIITGGEWLPLNRAKAMRSRSHACAGRSDKKQSHRLC